MPLTFLLLSIAVLSLWLPVDNKKAGSWRLVWLAIWLASLVAALCEGLVAPTGAAVALLFLGVMVGFRRAQTTPLKVLAAVAIAGISIALLLHRLPGFQNPRVIDGVRFTPDARPFTLYLNFDKTLIGLFVLGVLHARIGQRREWKAMLAKTLPLAVATIALIMVLSLAAGYVRWSPKLPRESGLWLGVNLLFVCTAEEGFFRGFIQTQLQRVWSTKRGGAYAALGVSAAAFGLAHFWGGWTYVALASVAGFGYGWIYQRTQRIEASILAHFALNTVHFFLFTYPALA